VLARPLHTAGRMQRVRRCFRSFKASTSSVRRQALRRWAIPSQRASWAVRSGPTARLKCRPKGRGSFRRERLDGCENNLSGEAACVLLPNPLSSPLFSSEDLGLLPLCAASLVQPQPSSPWPFSGLL